MMSQSGKLTITIHILVDFSRSKCNQTIRFGQLIEYNMRNIFLQKSFTTFGGETTIIDKVYETNSSFHVK